MTDEHTRLYREVDRWTKLFWENAGNVPSIGCSTMALQAWDTSIFALTVRKRRAEEVERRYACKS